MTYKVHLELNVVNAETGRGVAMARLPGDARRIAALLNKAAGMTKKDIDSLPDGGLALVIEERNAAQQMLDQALARERRLRAALVTLERAAAEALADVGDRSPVRLPLTEALNSAWTALADDA